MEKNVKLFKHQQELLDLNPDKWLLAWGTGSGKTRTAIELSRLKEPVLVICPKSLVDNWAKEVEKWGGVGFSVVSKEGFKKLHADMCRYNTLIIDEAHYFSNYKSQLTKSLYVYIEKHNPKNIYLLTATPYLSSPWNIYSLAKILGRNWSWIKFKQKFFYDIKMGNRLIPVIRQKIEQDIAELVNKLGSTVKLEDCFDVPEQIFQQEYFVLTSEQTRAISGLPPDIPIVQFTKTHQICGGTLKGDGYTETQHFKSDKLERLLELINEHPLIAVVCRYNEEINYLYETIKTKYKGRKLWKITGQVDCRQEIVEDIRLRDEGVVLINAACSEGYGLPTVPIMVFYSYDFSLKNYIQIIGRIQRADNIKKNIYLSLIVKDTIDEDIYNKVVVEKQDFHIEIMNYE